MIDPIVEEVRGFRKEHAQRFNFDLSVICVDIRQFEVSCGHEVVELPPRRLEGRVNLVRSGQSDERACLL